MASTDSNMEKPLGGLKTSVLDIDSLQVVHTSATVQYGESDDVKGDDNNLDDAILRAQGHEVAMERNFSWLGSIGLGFR